MGAESISAPTASAQTITEFSAGITETPWNITPGPDGNLWFTQFSHQIGRITPEGDVTEFSAGSLPNPGPVDITAGPDGNLWYTENSSNRIGRMSPSGTIIDRFSLGLTPAANLSDITAGPDGNLWFTEPAVDQIGKITTAGVVTEYAVPGGDAPIGITAGPDGNLWFTLAGVTDQIGKIDTAGTVTLFPGSILAAGSNPSDITTGPDGNLWFTEPGGAGQKIGRMTTGGVLTEFNSGITFNSDPSYIAEGADGNLWFTENVGDQVARITPAGVVTEFSSGITSGAAPRGIAAGADGNLWFVEAGLNQIARVELAGSPPPGPPAPPPPAPVQGQTVTVSPVSGTVLVKLPGANSFTPLGEADSIPVGSTVDTRNGVVELTSASDKAGNTQTAQFKFGLFKLTQAGTAGAFTDLKLTGPLNCAKGKKRSLAAGDGPTAQIAARRGRRLWGSGSGRFRSSGSRGSGSARGTIWQVSDRCDKTTEIRSIKGKVTAEDFVRKRTVVLTSGKRYVAPGPRSRKK